jgi:hypothetical protein
MVCLGADQARNINPEVPPPRDFTDRRRITAQCLQIRSYLDEKVGFLESDRGRPAGALGPPGLLPKSPFSCP